MYIKRKNHNEIHPHALQHSLDRDMNTYVHPLFSSGVAQGDNIKHCIAFIIGTREEKEKGKHEKRTIMESFCCHDQNGII